MKHQDIVTLLKSFGFSGLTLVSAEGDTTTLRFQDYNHSSLVKSLGQPTLAGGGKVAVFQIPKVARIGVSPTNSVLRFISEADTGVATVQHHLGFVKVPPAYSTAYLKASINTGHQVPYLRKIWEFLNKTKFAGKMVEPRLGVKESLGAGVRAHYIGNRSFTAGTIEVARFLFNAREPFFLEVFLHEMCHQATREISRSLDMSENGHGAVWQQWMVDVGLDPRRFDPTDPAEYQTHTEFVQKESELNQRYGSRAKEADLKALRKLTGPPHGTVIMLFQGRLLEGLAVKTAFHGKNIVDDRPVSIHYKTPEGLMSQQFFHKA